MPLLHALLIIHLSSALVNVLDCLWDLLLNSTHCIPQRFLIKRNTAKYLGNRRLYIDALQYVASSDLTCNKTENTMSAFCTVSMMLCYVIVKTVVSIDRIRMLKTDCSGETRLAPHVPSSLSWKAL